MSKATAKALALGAFLVIGSGASAAPVTLVDQNSRLKLDPTLPSFVTDWEINGNPDPDSIDLGKSQLREFSLWYRLPSHTQEFSLSSLPYKSIKTPTDGDDDTGNEHLFIRYGDGTTKDNSNFWIDVEFNLSGGSAGSVASLLATNITVTNRQSSPLNISLFQYVDFTVGGKSVSDTQLFSNKSYLTGGGCRVRDEAIDAGLAMDTVFTGPTPIDYEFSVGDPLTTGLHHRLIDVSRIVLDDHTPGPVSLDTNWATQWDFAIAAHGTGQVGEQMRLDSIPTVPLPSAGMAGLLLGAIGCLRRRRIA